MNRSIKQVSITLAVILLVGVTVACCSCTPYYGIRSIQGDYVQATINGCTINVYDSDNNCLIENATDITTQGGYCWDKHTVGYEYPDKDFSVHAILEQELLPYYQACAIDPAVVQFANDMIALMGTTYQLTHRSVTFCASDTTYYFDPITNDELKSHSLTNPIIRTITPNGVLFTIYLFVPMGNDQPAGISHHGAVITAERNDIIGESRIFSCRITAGPIIKLNKE